ncbi:MAG: 4Fe-4S binding protein [Bacillota bacterium]|nr:4Fe-4S binding protein [Bacillota bacterium]
MYEIIEKRCCKCGLCADVCPVQAISQIGVYEISVELCTKCGLCQESCPCEAIVWRDIYF